MSEQLAAADWASLRGAKWATYLDGMEAMLQPVDEPLIEALQLGDAPFRIADIGCGGGGATIDIARRAAPGSVVHGYDISPVLVEQARRRSQAAEFHLSDVSVASPPATPYDRLVSRFGIMFFDDPAAAFANLRRFLAPTGRFAFAVWAAPSANPWMKLVKDTVAEFLEIPPVDPDAPGPFRYAEAGKLIALLEGAGFRNLELREWNGKLAIGGGLPAALAAQFAIESSSSLADWIKNERDREAMAQALTVLTRRFATCMDNGAVHLDARVHLLTGSGTGQDS